MKTMYEYPFHHIEKHILKVLMYNESARYRDLRPDGVESNLFNYYRKKLLARRYIVQGVDKSYRLGPRGLRVVQHISYKEMKPRLQPRASVLFIVANAKGEVAFWKKPVQPFIGTYNLLNGKIHFDDTSYVEAAQRLFDELFIGKALIEPAGVADVCVRDGDDVIAHNLFFVMRVNGDNLSTRSSSLNLEWIDTTNLDSLNTDVFAPAVLEIIKDFYPVAAKKHPFNRCYNVKLG